MPVACIQYYYRYHTYYSVMIIACGQYCCCRGLPGLVDIVMSGVWAIFFLAAGGSIADYGSCSSWGYSWSNYYGVTRWD